MQVKVAKKWTSNVEAPEEFEKKLIEQKVLFQRLYELLEEKGHANYMTKLKKVNYEIKNWSEFQADAIGYERCLEEIKTLLKFTQE